MPVRRAQQILKENSNVQDVKEASQPKLLPRHTTARMQYDQKHLLWDDERKKAASAMTNLGKIFDDHLK